MRATVPVRRHLHRIVLGCTALVLLPVGVEAYRLLLGSSFHTVTPRRIYRCSQPTAATLDRLIAEHGIRTVINRRGSCDPFPWYLDEARATHRHNISQEDICFSAGRLPAVP